MALIWKKQTGDTCYEVRSAGRSVRLYTNGVFHSQFNSTNPVTGSVWDLLMLPAFFLPRRRLKRILVLGVGGGAVLRQLNHFFRPDLLVGVELDSVHLHIARNYYGNTGDNIALIEGDAVDWVNRYRGERFDMVIDDIFGEQAGEPIKAVVADGAWFRALLQVLKPHGLIVSNFVSPTDLRNCAAIEDERIGCRFKSAYQLTTPQYENAVGAFLRSDGDSGSLRKRLQEFPELDKRRARCRLRYKLKRLQLA